MLWGMSPLASHAVNLLWHIVCGLLVWLLAQRMLARWGWHPTPARGAALVAALFFVALPANVEAVAWFAARADMVAFSSRRRSIFSTAATVIWRRRSV